MVTGGGKPGAMPTGRQGNLIVTSTNSVKDAELRQRFVAEIKKQGKPYGLYFEDIQGGFTLTGRAQPQVFQVLPVMVWRVYPDGRPDELVRGVDIVGTPLVALNNILVTGDTLQVFNGICGAESGQVPVSAAAPAMLFSQMEVQKRARGTERPPILPAPNTDSSSAANNRTPAQRACGQAVMTGTRGQTRPRRRTIYPRGFALVPGQCSAMARVLRSPAARAQQRSSAVPAAAAPSRPLRQRPRIPSYRP